MAISTLLSPFILSAEGGWVNNPADKGGETNRGITWSTWISIYKDTADSHNRFLHMTDEDWNSIFKPLFWDKCQGDNINYQRIANVIVDSFWGSGYNGLMSIQKLLGLYPDGILGTKSLAAINVPPADEPELYNKLIAWRENFFADIVKNDPSQAIFLKGWENRIANLVKFNANNFKV